MLKDAWVLGAPLLTLMAIGANAQAADTSPLKGVRYASAGAWVVVPPTISSAPTPPGAPVHILFADQQVRITSNGQEEYSASRIKLLTPEGLAVGNIAISWAPANEQMVVHKLSIIRDGQVIDVLAKQKFAVIQRENNLEQAMLDGNLTATLQTAGLRVGDEVHFAATKTRRDIRSGERPEIVMQFPIVGTRGAYRLRVIEPMGGGIAYRASADLPPPVTRTVGADIERQFLLTDPASVTIPEGAPPRYSIARIVQYSGYGDWAAVSRTFDTTFRQAMALAPNSKVKVEAARIAAATTDPVRRAEAALRLVQDQVRYVYVGLDGGNYRPANAEETWDRRFGDCKAKTVLLVALLRELGIMAEPVLVASKGADGIDERLPTPGVFDHVVVRATVGQSTVWLDGTRLGDRLLANLEPPQSRWALPLRASGAGLEPIAAPPPRWPHKIETVEIDASAGSGELATYRIQQTLRGDEIFQIRAQLAGVAPADADKMLASYWRQFSTDIEPTRTTWRFDEANRLLVLSMEGKGKMDWEGDATEGRTHYLFGGGFPPPAEMKRPAGQPQDAPWANDYPVFSCYATTVKVPTAGKGFRWSFSSSPMDRMLGGTAYWRISSFDGKVARMVKSRRVDLPELSAREAAAVNVAIAGFDNNKSYIWEVSGQKSNPSVSVDPTSNFGTFEEFAGAAPPCQSQTMRAARSSN